MCVRGILATLLSCGGHVWKAESHSRSQKSKLTTSFSDLMGKRPSCDSSCLRWKCLKGWVPLIDSELTTQQQLMHLLWGQVSQILILTFQSKVDTLDLCFLALGSFYSGIPQDLLSWRDVLYGQLGGAICALLVNMWNVFVLFNNLRMKYIWNPIKHRECFYGRIFHRKLI